MARFILTVLLFPWGRGGDHLLSSCSSLGGGGMITSSFGDGEMATRLLSLREKRKITTSIFIITPWRQRGDGHLHSSHSCLGDGEMITSISGDGEMTPRLLRKGINPHVCYYSLKGTGRWPPPFFFSGFGISRFLLLLVLKGGDHLPIPSRNNCNNGGGHPPISSRNKRMEVAISILSSLGYGEMATHLLSLREKRKI